MPDQPGTKDMNGCPDSDGDGVNDNIDECPNQAGSISGCPDSDGDGIADKNDECPNQLVQLKPMDVLIAMVMELLTKKTNVQIQLEVKKMKDVQLLLMN